MFYLFIYLAFINVFDGIATYMGLIYGKIEEANPLMRYLFELEPGLFLSTKLGLSLLLLIIYYFLTKAPKSNFIRNIVLFSSIIYTVVCVKHVYWMSVIYRMH